MARIRTIKPEFWTDEKVVELSPLARLLFIGLWNFADDDGRLIHSPKQIKLRVLPADDADISELLGEIRRKGMIIVYQVEDKEVLQILNFAEHQKVDKRRPSKLPPAPNGAEKQPRIKEWIKEGIKERIKEKPLAASPTGLLAIGEGEELLKIPDNRSQEIAICKTFVTELEVAYPAVDSLATLREIRAWCVANPEKRKTRKGMARFVNAWFAREQNRGA